MEKVEKVSAQKMRYKLFLVALTTYAMVVVGKGTWGGHISGLDLWGFISFLIVVTVILIVVIYLIWNYVVDSIITPELRLSESSEEDITSSKKKYPDLLGGYDGYFCTLRLLYRSKPILSNPIFKYKLIKTDGTYIENSFYPLKKKVYPIEKNHPEEPRWVLQVANGSKDFFEETTDIMVTRVIFKFEFTLDIEDHIKPNYFIIQEFERANSSEWRLVSDHLLVLNKFPYNMTKSYKSFRQAMKKR